jgi:hypothetical protein
MATSVYFSGSVKSEQELYEDLIIESMKIYGQDVVYIPRQEITRDEILNESYSKFTDSYVVEMYIEGQEGFEGEGDLLAKFGLEIRDQATFIVSKRRWEKQVGGYLNTTHESWEEIGFRPMEGDLLFLPMSNSIFEIRFVEHEMPFYQLQNLPVYKLQAELFEYSDEKLDTDIAGVDIIETINATSYTYSMKGSNDNYIIGEKVIQWTGENDSDGNAINIEGEVAAFEDLGLETGNLTVVSLITTEGRFRELYPSDVNPVVGTESGTSYMCITSSQDHPQPVTNYNRDSYAANDQFDHEGDDIIDFSETNPFGMP